MRKKIKVYAVIWTKAGQEEYGVPDKYLIVNAEPLEAITYRIDAGKGRPAIRYASLTAIFPTKIEAEAFRAGNNDWKVVPCSVDF